jgi:hypothetical protein
MKDLSSIVLVSQRDRTCVSYSNLCAMTGARNCTWLRVLRDTTWTSRLSPPSRLANVGNAIFPVMVRLAERGGRP